MFKRQQPTANSQQPMFLLLLCLLFCGNSLAATKPLDRGPAESELDANGLEGARQVFQRLALAFESNDVQACMRLIVGSAQGREKLRETLKREFQQSHYKRFEIINVLPDDTLKLNCHTVDVHLHYVMTRGDATQDIENTTMHNFVIQKLDDGTFALVSSSFFDGLGLKSGVDKVITDLLIVMGVLALFGFSIWMGCEAWFLRPRKRVWRAIVFVPVFGAMGFFIFKYIRSSKGNVVNSR